MAASSVTVRPSPIEIARAVGAAVPTEVSAQPLLGILGVVTGAGVVTLTSRMISLGMPDFRGLHGFGYDGSAWISSAFDAGLMFIGPFTVYLGGLIGPRRILLTAAALFTALLIFLPFAHSYSLMMICIYYGIPKENAPKKSGKAPDFAGFLYASAGLAMLLLACEQGERLDWWRCGVLNALFAGGAFFLLCALVRRLRGPNPLVALPYLLKWNTMLLGSLLFWFRFTLCTTIILVPQALAIRGFEAEQIGPAIIWSAVPLIPLAFTAGLLLLRKFDPRLLLAIGLACTAFAAWLNSQYSSMWAAENFYRTELLTGVGQAFAFIGLVGCIVLQAIFAGALAKPEWVLTFSAFFHTIRIFGGTAGAIYMGHFLAQREKLHSNLLGVHVSNGDWLTGQNIHAMTAGLYAKSSGLATAGARAVDLIAARVRLQAFSLSIIDGFVLIAWSCVCALILVTLLRKSPLNYGELSTIRQAPADGKESK